MKVTGSGGVQLLVLEAEPGEELISAAVAALRASGAPFAWLVARGTLREVLLESASRGGVTRAFEGTLELASASGVWRGHDESIVLSGVVAREIDRGSDVVAGRIEAAVAENVELICFLAGPVQASPQRASSAQGSSVQASPAARPAETRPAETRPVETRPAETRLTEEPATVPSLETYGPSSTPSAPTQLPPKPLRRAAAEESGAYPEPGDRVAHFAFGDCSVESSDGDRIHLKQDKDGRVREVSLAMLRISPPEIDAEGRKLFRLQRKN